MSIFRSILLFIFLFFLEEASGQLSPGELSSAHADLEGISQCTKCHVLGDKVSNDKCLDCHKEIRQSVNRNKGYHSSRAVKGKECADCHSDHHGRKFDMVRFDTATFDHALTGYALTGAHRRIDCRDCHRPEYIADDDIRRKEGTYLGMGQACLDCHEDYHQKTLSSDCAQCHTTEKFAPATRFDHDRSDYPLRGKHQAVACVDCHREETRNGKLFQVFKGIAFANCNSCHADPHQNQLGTQCKECHVEQSFAARDGWRRFQHQRTGFPLKGRHQQVQCADCHQLAGTTPSSVFQDKAGTGVSDCAACHTDVHEGRFGGACADCHNEDSFRRTGDMASFDHDRTDFPLEGRHVSVDCRDCHTSGRMTDALPHQACTDCHTDYHEGQFAAGGRTRDCADCHLVEGFEASTFSFEQHAQAGFPLEGAHVATPCFACHLKEEKWVFREIGNRCIDCHADVHGETLAERWYLTQACENCHTVGSWTESNLFDHDSTPFPLEGQHGKERCSACHQRDTDYPYGRFAGLPNTCQGCHEDPHFGQFAEEATTDCMRCHGFEEWRIPDFDHDRTRFKLEGKHAAVACEACHRAESTDGGTYVIYRLEKFECVDCHGND
jgi:hypothetical protein